MMWLRVVCAFAVLALAGATPVSAQTCHALGGHWTLDPAASRMGANFSFNPAYRITAIDLTFAPGDHVMRQSWHWHGQNLDETDSFDVSTDDSLHPTGAHSVLNAVPSEVKGHWENCALVDDGRTSLRAISLWTQSRYIISPDGATLTIRQIGHTDIIDIDRAPVFHRAAQGAQ